MYKLYCIAAGQLHVKKKDHRINRQNRYLNYGLLSLVTKLYQDGWDPIQIQGDFDLPEITFNKCIDYGLDYSLAPILISIPSFYAISWVNEFIHLVKSRKPETKFIIGGRWVIDGQVELMTNLVPQADLIVSGLADHSICKIIREFLSPFQAINLRETIATPFVLPLDYSLLADRKLYQPSLEISRGCGMGCSFCQEKDERLSPLKEPNFIVQESKEIVLQDKLREMHPYFETSIFVPNSRWIDNLIHSRENHGCDFHWRTEGRVDSINPKYIKRLKSSGLKILDLGLESASPNQLLRMNKSKTPKKYLERASTLLKAAHEEGIAIKVNVLLTSGETNQSIEETIKWLDRHETFITGVSVGPVIVYGWPSRTKAYLDELREHGATISHSPILGVTHLNLSNEIDYERSIDISNKIGRRYMSAESYFYLKSFSYYSRDYTYIDFKSDIISSKNDYGFDISGIETQKI